LALARLRVFAFGAQEPVLDVNVKRVHERTGLEPFAIPKDQADEWHQLLMDFGAMVCTAKAPKCGICPVSRLCEANKIAQAKGFPTYASWVATQPKVKKQSKKDVGKKFEETDRYFRGRIIDFLREEERGMEAIWLYLNQTHSLQERVRFGRIIESLVVDGLIQVRGNTVSLA
jgi:A/G-specific adenine glycosylase